MTRLDAAADPRHAIERGLYVPRIIRKGRTLHEEMAGRLELQPASTHLVVGGIGSGKTTQLLVAQERLSKLPDTIAVYVDVSALHDISKLQPRVLLILAGQRLAALLSEDARKTLSNSLRRLQAIGSGYLHSEYYDPRDDEEPPEDYADDDRDDDPRETVVWKPGIIVPPATDVPSPPPRSEPGQILGEIKSALGPRAQHIVLLFDSMDRVVDITRFEQVVVDDLAVMRALGIGVVVVGPTKLLYGTYREITRRFDQMHPVTLGMRRTSFACSPGRCGRHRSTMTHRAMPIGPI
jgi:hypothetical protein